MKFNNKILEAVNRGIQLALDDYQDDGLNNLSSNQNDVIDTDDTIKKRVDLNKIFVDLGLPSGTLWCKHYIGIEYIESPSGELVKKTDPTSDNNCINYYAWGETEPNKDVCDKTKFGWTNYKFLRGQQTIIKYSPDWDNLTQLEDEDDVAYQKFHIYNFKFHIPTKEQFEELLEYTTYKYIDEYTSDYKHKWGGELISKINGKSIFFPFTSAKSLQDSFMGGYLWSSTMYNDRQAWYLSFGSNFCKLDYIQKCDGLPICPVCKP